MKRGLQVVSIEPASCCDDPSCSSDEPAAAPVAPPTTGLATYRIHGMCCAEEVATLKRVLAPHAPADALSFDILNSRMTAPSAIGEQAVIEAIAPTGMRAERWTEGEAQEAPQPRFPLRDVLVAVSVVATVAGFAVHRNIFLVAVAAGLWVVLPKAWYALRTLRPDMNLLMTIAVAGALIIGEWFEAATVSALFALSLALEAWSVGRARRAVEALMSIAPDVVRVRVDGEDREVVPGSVAIGTRFFVHPGERIGLDGAIAAGATSVDQAPITGESIPVAKAVGDTVFAGTINGSGAIEVVSSHAAGETTLARIVRLVADSQANRARSEQFVERFARIYTPAILAFALAVAVIPPLFGGAWADWTYRALVLLVIGCPCALVISTPVAIVASLAASARQGVLLKGGRVAELPARIAVVALDKTGTLTHGRPEVVEIVPLGDHDSDWLLGRAGALERASTHPIALAILQAAADRGVPVVPAEDVVAVHGKGVEGRIDGRQVWLGSHRWLEERGLETPEHHARLEELASAGCSVVVVGADAHVCGFIAVSDGVREESRAAVQALRDAGIAQVVMLTGDNRATGEAVGAKVGVDSVLSELLPEDKVAAVARLEREVGPVAMVGDGINDAPALARATLGVAMGAAGTDVAIETADIALMGDDLSKLAWLVGHARATVAVIQANIALALGIKVVFVVLTFAGLASLWGAVAADMGGSLIVVANALRLLRRG